MQLLPERFSLDPGHDVVEQAVGLARVVHRQDVRMAQLGRDLDFPEEPVGAEGGGELGPHDLDGHLPAVLQVFGEVDRRHAAFAQHPLDRIPVRDRLADPGDLNRAGGRGPTGDPGLGRCGGATPQAELGIFGQWGLAGGAGSGSSGHRDRVGRESAVNQRGGISREWGMDARTGELAGAPGGSSGEGPASRVGGRGDHRGRQGRSKVAKKAGPGCRHQRGWAGYPRRVERGWASITGR